VFLKVINLFLFIHVCNLVYYVIKHYVNKSKNKLILELSELRDEMLLSTVNMEMAGFGNLVLCTQFQRETYCCLHLQGRRRKQVPLKGRCICTRVDGVVSQKTTVISVGTHIVVTLPETNDGKCIRLFN
jgi:hypothetical protein